MVLDDPTATARIDRSNVLRLVGRFGAMLLDGWSAAAVLSPVRPRPAVVVAAGVGGSGIGGDVLRVLLAPVAAVPVVSVKDDRLPAFVGPQTLVCACSYSGDTAETLAMFEAARAAGATVVAITSGGALAERARAAQVPLVTVPAAMPPRAALPYTLAATLRVMSAAGLAGPDEEGVREAAGLLEDLAGRWGPVVPAAHNPAKQLALRIGATMPVIYAASSLTAPVAARWKTQCNENAKRLAAWDVFPELTHNEIVGWAGDAPAAGGRFVVLLRDPDDGPGAQGQIAATREFAFARARGVEEVWTHGIGRLARLLSLIQLGDYVSVYLALLTGVDPAPVDVITAVKIRMQEGPPPRGTL